VRIEANKENLDKIFTIPEGEHSTLLAIEREISANIDGFLKQHIVAEEAEPSDIQKEFSSTFIPEDPMLVADETHFLLKNVVSRAVHTSSPSFVGHMTSAFPYFMLPMAKIMTALNQNLVKIETSKSFTPLEKQVLGMMHRLVYAKESSFYDKYTHTRDSALGVFCSGGTIANLTGLWVARNKYFGPKEGFNGIGKEGIAQALNAYGYKDMCVLVSRMGHYSLRKATDLLGLGSSQLMQIPTDDNFKIDTVALRQKLSSLRSEGIAPIAIVAVAGTTETGHVDPIDELAALSKEFGCHLHVDAAWGGPTLFSQSYQHILKGIEKADSVVIDAHKQMYVPVGAGMCVFQDPKDLKFIEQSANYIVRKGSRDLGKHSIEGSRNGMALLVHAGLHIIGKRGYAMLIDRGIELAKNFAEMIKTQEDFELISEPETNILTYRYVPNQLKSMLQKDPQKANAVLNLLTQNIQKKQRRRGKTFVSRTTLFPKRYNEEKVVVFRVVLANPMTTEEILADILVEQREIGQSF
jgi:putative pyridoxal-dependent aspartate 1-decarboxylase